MSSPARILTHNRAKYLMINESLAEIERKTHTFLGLPMIVETAVVASEKMGSVSTPSKLRLVVM